MFARKQGFKSFLDYLEWRVRENGYPSRYEYHRALKHGFSTYAELQNYDEKKEDEKFFQVHETRKNTVLNQIPVNDNSTEKNETAIILHELISTLDPIEQEIINGRYFSNRTGEQLGVKLDRFRQGIQQLEAKALERLRPRAIEAGLKL